MINGVSLGLAGMSRYARMFDRAAEQVIHAGMRDVDPAIEVEGGVQENPNAEPAVVPAEELIDGMAEMMLAQRLFIASLQVARVEDEMLEKAVSIAHRK